VHILTAAFHYEFVFGAPYSLAKVCSLISLATAIAFGFAGVSQQNAIALA
jgi:hypothetical protein